MKPDFEKAQNTATKILLQQNITGFFIDVRTFSTANNIIIDSMQNFCKLTGFSLSNFKKNKMAGACLVKKMAVILYFMTIPCLTMQESTGELHMNLAILFSIIPEIPERKKSKRISLPLRSLPRKLF